MWGASCYREPRQNRSTYFLVSVISGSIFVTVCFLPGVDARNRLSGRVYDIAFRVENGACLNAEHYQSATNDCNFVVVDLETLSCGAAVGVHCNNALCEYPFRVPRIHAVRRMGESSNPIGRVKTATDGVHRVHSILRALKSILIVRCVPNGGMFVQYNMSVPCWGFLALLFISRLYLT
jgi:hypothetical protein